MANVRCATCGTHGTLGESIRELEELGFGPDVDGSTIRLCRACLDLRDTKAWDLDDSEGRRLFEALQKQTPSQPHGRYSYLVEPDEDIHLVRLRTDWVQDHAAPA